MVMKIMQSLPESVFFGTICCFHNFQVPAHQNFITNLIFYKWCYALFTAKLKTNWVFHESNKIVPLRAVL